MRSDRLKSVFAAGPRVLFEALFAAVTLYTARPAFASLHLPLQDLPQHMAAISVLRRLASDAGLRAYFELTLSRTQYLSVYALGVPLSYACGVEYATRLLVALTVVALPYALRFALRRTDGDERYASLVWPFAWNPQMMLGFLNFLIGIPLALVAIGLFADRDRRTRVGRQVALGALALGAFYSHLVPYGLLGLGVLLQLDAAPLPDAARAAVAATRGATGAERMARVRMAALALGRAAAALLLRWARETAFLLPSAVAAAVWVLRSPARDPAIRAGGVGRELVTIWPTPAQLPAEFRDTLLNLQGDADDRALIAWGLALLAALALGRAGDVATPSDADPPGRAARARVAWLPFACAVLYVRSPASYGWIWPIHTRFALAAVLLLPLALARARHAAVAWVVMLAMANATVPLTGELVRNFQRWDREELGDLDQALAHARPGRRLVALVPATRSEYVPSNVPTLHAAAYYQVRGGHVATFSFADFPQSPFRYRDGAARPPRLQPRWEWESSLVTADPGRDYYDYVLVRAGARDEPAELPGQYARLFGGEQWSLYERRR